MQHHLSNQDIGVVLFITPEVKALQAQLVQELTQALSAAQADQTLCTSATISALNAALTQMNGTAARLFVEHGRIETTVAALRENELRALQTQAEKGDYTPDLIA